MKCSVFKYERRWQLQNSFSLHFLFDPSTASSRQASSSSPLLLLSSPLVQPLVPHLHFFVSTACQLWDTVMTHLSVTLKMPDKQTARESVFISGEWITIRCWTPHPKSGNLCRLHPSFLDSWQLAWLQIVCCKIWSIWCWLALFLELMLH